MLQSYFCFLSKRQRVNLVNFNKIINISRGNVMRNKNNREKNEQINQLQ